MTSFMFNSKRNDRGKNIRYTPVTHRGAKQQSPAQIAAKNFKKFLMQYNSMLAISDDDVKFYTDRVLSMEKSRIMHMPTLAAVVSFLHHDVKISPNQNMDWQTAMKITSNLLRTDKNILDNYINKIPDVNKYRVSKKVKRRHVEDTTLWFELKATFIRYIIAFLNPIELSYHQQEPIESDEEYESTTDESIDDIAEEYRHEIEEENDENDYDEFYNDEEDNY